MACQRDLAPNRLPPRPPDLSSPLYRIAQPDYPRLLRSLTLSSTNYARLQNVQ